MDVTNLIWFQKMSDSEEPVNMWDMLPDKLDEWDPFRYDAIVQTGAELCWGKVKPPRLSFQN